MPIPESRPLAYMPLPPDPSLLTDEQVRFMFSDSAANRRFVKRYAELRAQQQSQFSITFIHQAEKAVS